MSNPSINFFSEEIDFNLSNTDEISAWLNTIIKNHKRKIEYINYVFCSDKYLLQINKEHLNHDYYTDIITFDMGESDKIESDVFISIDRVMENAKSLDVVFEKELMRVLVHGLLHLIGFNDKTDNEKTIMRKKEDSCLSLLKL